MKRRNFFRTIGTFIAASPLIAFALPKTNGLPRGKFYTLDGMDAEKQLTKLLTEEIRREMLYNSMDDDKLISNILDIYTEAVYKIINSNQPYAKEWIRGFLKYGDKNNPSILEKINREWKQKYLMENVWPPFSPDHMNYVEHKIKAILPTHGIRFQRLAKKFSKPMLNYWKTI